MFPLVRLASKYSEMTKNGQLLSLRASIEVIRTRIQDLAGRIDMNEAPDRLAKLDTLWNELWQADKAGDRAEFIVKKAELDGEFEKLYHDYAAWKQMFEAVDLDRKLVESEVKIIKDIKATLTAEDAYELVAKLLSVIIQTVNSANDIPAEIRSKLLQRISYEFSTAIGDGVNAKNVQRFAGGSGEDQSSEPGEVD